VADIRRALTQLGRNRYLFISSNKENAIFNFLFSTHACKQKAMSLFCLVNSIHENDEESYFKLLSNSNQKERLILKEIKRPFSESLNYVARTSAIISFVGNLSMNTITKVLIEYFISLLSATLIFGTIVMFAP